MKSRLRRIDPIFSPEIVEFRNEHNCAITRNNETLISLFD